MVAAAVPGLLDSGGADLSAARRGDGRAPVLGDLCVLLVLWPVCGDDEPHLGGLVVRRAAPTGPTGAQHHEIRRQIELGDLVRA